MTTDYCAQVYELYSIIISDYRAQVYILYSIIITNYRAQVYKLYYHKWLSCPGI